MVIPRAESHILCECFSAFFHPLISPVSQHVKSWVLLAVVHSAHKKGFANFGSVSQHVKPGFHWLSLNRPTGKHSRWWFLAPGLCILGFCSFCALSSTATSTQRRRERKIRAQARLRWFLHRKGHRVLTSAQLEQIHRQLRVHHSRDPKFLKLIQKEMASMRSTSQTRQPKDPPWRCGPCKRLVKGKEEYCPGCHYHWTEVQDTSYAPYNWASEQQTPWQKQSRTSRSPRTRGQSRSRQRTTWDWTQEQWPEMPKPVVVPPPKGKGKGKEPAWQAPALPSVPAISPGEASTASTGVASQQLRDLVGALKKDQDKLSPEVVTLLQQAQIQDSRNTTRQLHVAVSQLGQTRKSLQDLEKAKLTMYQSWATFVSDSLDRWTSYAEDFKAKDIELNKQIEEARKAVHKSKENFVNTQKSSGAATADTTVISDEEETVAAPEGVVQGLDAMMNGLQEMKRNMDEAVVQQTKRQKVQEPTEGTEAVKNPDQGFQQGGSWDPRFSVSALRRLFGIIVLQISLTFSPCGLRVRKHRILHSSLDSQQRDQGLGTSWSSKCTDQTQEESPSGTKLKCVSSVMKRLPNSLQCMNPYCHIHRSRGVCCRESNALVMLNADLL